MLREIVKHPRSTPQTLQASVPMLNVKVHGSTTRKRRGKYCMTCLEGLLFSKNYSCIWTNLNISGTLSFGHLKPKWRCLAIMHSAKLGKTKHISPNTLYQLLEGWWFFGFFFFVATGPGHLQSLSRTQTPLYTKVFLSQMWGYLSKPFLPSTPANLQQNSWKRKESRRCTSPVKVQTSTRLK